MYFREYLEVRDNESRLYSIIKNSFCLLSLCVCVCVCVCMFSSFFFLHLYPFMLLFYILDCLVAKFKDIVLIAYVFNFT